jgi:hypothetical protein
VAVVRYNNTDAELIAQRKLTRRGRRRLRHRAAEHRLLEDDGALGLRRCPGLFQTRCRRG